MAPVSIRTAQLDDLPRLREIFRLSSLSNEGDRANLLAHPEHLELGCQAIIEQHLRLAEIGGVVVGFATASPAGAFAELEDLFVHPEWMRRGVAMRLVADAVDRASQAGLTRIEVTANPHAMAFYLRAGFRARGAAKTAFEPGLRMYLSTDAPPGTPDAGVSAL